MVAGGGDEELGRSAHRARRRAAHPQPDACAVVSADVLEVRLWGSHERRRRSAHARRGDHRVGRARGGPRGRRGGDSERPAVQHDRLGLHVLRGPARVGLQPDERSRLWQHERDGVRLALRRWLGVPVQVRWHRGQRDGHEPDDRAGDIHQHGGARVPVSAEQQRG